MRITFILRGFLWTPAGGFKIVYEYANHLVARGHEVFVVHARYMRNSPPPPDIYHWVRNQAAHILSLLLKPDLTWQPIDKRVHMLFVPEPTARYIPGGDVVFATAWQTAEYVIEYSPDKGRQFYLVMDFDPWLGPKERLESTWRWPLKKVAISHWLYEKVIQAGGDNVVAIPCAIDYRRFQLTKDIGARPKMVAMMYSTAKYKGVEYGIRALEICKARHPDLQAVLFGSFFGLTFRPIYVPRWILCRKNVSEKELTQIYNQSRIYLCSSLAEGFALPPAEAMACGCSVVSTDCGGIREYAEHGVNALLSTPKDSEALAQNIIRLLEDENLRIRLAKAGYNRIRNFTWERSTDLLERFLTDS